MAKKAKMKKAMIGDSCRNSRENSLAISFPKLNCLLNDNLRLSKTVNPKILIVGIMWISLSYAVPLSRRLGDTGSQVIARFFGFVLLAIGWSILTKGLMELMPGLAG